MIRVFRPLPENHPAVGMPCVECGFPLRPGQRTVLIPKPETREGFRCEAGIAHATCALAGLRTPAGVIKRIKDGDASPFPVIMADTEREATLAECGLQDRSK